LGRPFSTAAQKSLQTDCRPARQMSQNAKHFQRGFSGAGNEMLASGEDRDFLMHCPQRGEIVAPMQ
jgi:hypothetical protein